MPKRRKIALLTLLGLILPFGNIWGPYLMRLDTGSPDAVFRSKLTAFELAITILSYAVAITFIVWGLKSDNNTRLMSTGLHAIVFQILLILVTALFLFSRVKKDNSLR